MVCSCSAGFEGTGFSCADLNECLSATDNNCDATNGTCTNVDNGGGFTCGCQVGWRLDLDGITCLPEEVDCTDGNDDDSDALFDCADPDCFTNAACLPDSCAPVAYTPLAPLDGALNLPTDMLLWLRADVGLTVDENNLACVWEDQSHNRNHVRQLDAAYRPATGTSLGTKDALGFTGTETMSADTVLGLAPDGARTFIAVVELDDLTTRQVYFGQLQIGSSTQWFSHEVNTYSTAGNRFGLYVPSNSVDVDNATDTAPHVVVLRANTLASDTPVTDAASYRFDGANATLTHRAGPGSVGDFSLAQATFVGGAPPAGIGGALRGRISEAMVWGRALTDEEAGRVEVYLMARYGITP